MTELETAVQELQNNKAQGPDGLPGEFHKIFWNDISDFLQNLRNKVCCVFYQKTENT